MKHFTTIAIFIGLAAAANVLVAAPNGPLFRSSGDPLQYTNVVDTISNVAGYVPQAPGPELSLGGLPGDWGVYWVPTHSGVNNLRFAGAASPGEAVCAMKAYTVNLAVDKSTKLSYWIIPQQENAEYVGVDLHCTDGTLLSQTKAVDQNGVSLDPASGHGGIPILKWSHCQSQIGKWLAGKTVDKILVTYHRHDGGGEYRGYVDDIVITDGPIVSPSTIVASKALPAPEWARKGVIYGVSERQFSASGDLKGVDQGLSRLHELGVTVVWLMPINTIGVLRSIGSPYCVRDFYGIDPRFGTADDLHALVKDAHALGMKVILDETLDHTSWDSNLIDKHLEWYRHDDSDPTKPISRTPMWGDVAQLDYAQPALREYMLQMLRWWVKTYDIDGFRFDSAELLPTEFWDEASASIREVKPDALLLGESHRPEMMLGGINLDYSFTLYSAIVDVMQKKQPASFIKDAWVEEHAMFPQGTLHMRYSGNQDTGKPAADFGPDAAHALAVLAFTLDGIPMLYNGTEIDDTTSGHFLDSGKINWSSDPNHVDFTLFDPLVTIRKAWPALNSGNLTWVANPYPDKLLTFLRTSGDQQVFVAINLSADPLTTSDLPLPGAAGEWTEFENWAPGRGVPINRFDGKPYGYTIYTRRVK